MNAEELYRTWPGIDKANAETLLALPAWRKTTEYAGVPAVIRKAEAGANDWLNVAIAFEDESHVLGIADSPAFPDLHVLWGQRAALPSEVLLALVEKECGAFLQTLENAVGRQLAIRGLVDFDDAPAARAVYALDGEKASVTFAIDLKSDIVMAWGRTRNIDTGHETVRALTRPAYAEYAAIDLISAETAKLGVGGALLLPDDACGAWRVERPSDDLVHVRSAAAREISFAEMADDNWPPVPPSDGAEVELVRRGAVIARGVCGRVGLAPAVRITSAGNA